MFLQVFLQSNTADRLCLPPQPRRRGRSTFVDLFIHRALRPGNPPSSTCDVQPVAVFTAVAHHRKKRQERGERREEKGEREEAICQSHEVVIR